MAKLKKSSLSMNLVEVSKLGEEYSEISAQIKALNERKKVLADLIKKGAEEFGVKDDKGSFYYENEGFILGKVARKTVKLNQEKAINTLDSLGLEDVIDVITTRVVNEDKLEQAISEGRIGLNVVRDFTDIKVDYSVSVKEKAELEEVTETYLAVAKRK